MSYAIAQKQQPDLTYILSDDNQQSRLAIVPERGGVVTSWQIKGQEILYMDWERFANPEKSVRGGIPILFPICGDLPDNQYTYNGQTYRLNRHGFARDFPWQVTNQQTDKEAALTLTLNSNDDTRTVYPFDFEVSFTYRLKGNRLIIDQTYRNDSQQAMPFSSGLHPYFWVSDKTQMQLDIPASQYQDNLTQQTHSFQERFDFNQDEIDAQFRPLSRQLTSIAFPERGIKVELTFSSDYSTVVFWTLKGHDFVCLEPWTSPRNALNTRQNLLVIPPGKSQQLQIKLAINYL